MTRAHKITAANYEANLASLWALASLISEAPLGEMIAAAQHADAMGAILDPTLYREKARALSEDLEMLRALAHVKATIESMRSRQAARAGVTGWQAKGSG